MNINSFCDELLAEIFSFLPVKVKVKCEFVCKKWKIILNRYCQPKSLRLELMIYKRSNYRIICEKKDHVFTDLNTIKFEDEKDLHKISKILFKYRHSLTSLCFGFSFFNHFQYLIERTDCLNIMVNNLKNLEHFQCKSFGDGVTVELFERCKSLLSKIKHFSLDYKEEDLTKISYQPWIKVFLKYGTKLESVYIKFQRMGIKFPFHLPLPPNLRFLYLPSCDLSIDEFEDFLNNGGTKLEELSLHSIPSNCIKIMSEKMHNLKTLKTRIRKVSGKDDYVHDLKLLKKMDCFVLNRFISPAYNNDLIFTKVNSNLTVLDMIINCPQSKRIQLKSLPFFSRKNLNTYLSQGEDLESSLEFEENFLNDDVLFSDFEFAREEYNFLQNQIEELKNVKENWNYVRQLEIKLNERKHDDYFLDALIPLLNCFCHFKNLETLIIEKTGNYFLNSSLICDIFKSCEKLKHLHIGSGERINLEIIDLFIERSIKNPTVEYKLKYSNEEKYNIVLPRNLIFY